MRTSNYNRSETMKIAGRIIQNKNISHNSEKKFCATYKQHHIEISLHKMDKGCNPEWNCDIWHFNGGTAVSTIVQRCTIRDAIIYSLDGALL